MAIALIIIALLILLYMFLVMPALYRPDAPWLFEQDLAHRGLHGDKDENTLISFQKAKDAGYGIELDVQLTKDDELVVFHDKELTRLCGSPKKLRELTYRELQAYTVDGHRIPRLSDALTLIGGKVPVNVEVKMYDYNVKTICEKVSELLKKYPGPHCICSFDPHVLRWFKRNSPKTLRFLLVEDFFKLKGFNPVKKFLLQFQMLNVFARPHGLSALYNKPGFAYSLCRFFHAYGMGWTVREQSEHAKYRGDFDAMIFEKMLSAHKKRP